MHKINLYKFHHFILVIPQIIQKQKLNNILHNSRYQNTNILKHSKPKNIPEIYTFA